MILPTHTSGDLTRDVIAIVGSLEFVCPAGMAIARNIIAEELTGRVPDLVVSTGSDGVDKLAIAVAGELGVPALEFTAHTQWDGPHGEKATNAKVAALCTRALRISCRRSRTQGSGWITDRTAINNRPVRRIVIGYDGTVQDSGWSTPTTVEAPPT